MALSGKKKTLFWVTISVFGISVLAVVGVIVSKSASAPPSSKRQIVFVSHRDFRSSKTGNETALYIMNSDGSKQERLTDDKAVYTHPDWSPDGKHIVFVRKDSILTIDSQGYSRLTLTERGYFPLWSPDGRKIIFLRQTTGYENHLFIMNTDGSRKELLATGYVTQAQWSPDGKKIVCTKGRSGSDSKASIYLINPDGKREVALPAGESGDANSPCWSADGKKIVFSSFTGDEKGDIYTVGADGKDLKKPNLPETLGKWKYMPKWSPDGKRIAFLISESPPWSEKNDSINIAIAGVDGSKPLQLTHFRKSEYAVDVSWTTDSKTLLLTLARVKTSGKEKEVNSNIYLVTLTGKLIQLTKTGYDFSPDWYGSAH